MEHTGTASTAHHFWTQLYNSENRVRNVSSDYWANRESHNNLLSNIRSHRARWDGNTAVVPMGGERSHSNVIFIFILFAGLAAGHIVLLRLALLKINALPFCKLKHHSEPSLSVFRWAPLLSGCTLGKSPRTLEYSWNYCESSYLIFCFLSVASGWIREGLMISFIGVFFILLLRIYVFWVAARTLLKWKWRRRRRTHTSANCTVNGIWRWEEPVSGNGHNIVIIISAPSTDKYFPQPT